MALAQRNVLDKTEELNACFPVYETVWLVVYLRAFCHYERVKQPSFEKESG